MYRCIYCNSDDLSISDIIPFALTGAKLTRRFVCHGHNSFTNDNFEKKTIANWRFFRNALGLTERDGSEVRYNAKFCADGVTVKSMNVSGRSSIYNDKKRLFHGEQDGHDVLIGNTDKLKQKRGINAEEIKPLDMQDAVISVEVNLAQLLASEEMLRTMAKIAYEWHCYIHEIDCFHDDQYQRIVDCILLKERIEDVVEICVDGICENALATLCSPGSHAAFEYDDADGFRYVVFFFWGIVLYKTRLCSSASPNQGEMNIFDLYIYGLDGEKKRTVFGTLGKSHLASIPAEQAVQTYYQLYKTKIERLLKTTILSLTKVKGLSGALRTALSLYKREPHDFARFIDYESVNRFYILSLLLFLDEHKDEYDFRKGFNENIRSLYHTQEQLVVTNEDKKAFMLRLQKLHEKGQLIPLVENGLAFFDRICEQEKKELL